MMNKLPFLKGTKWPRIGKPVGESKYGFSEDDELMEGLLNELMAAYEAKDHIGLITALKSLIDLIKSKEGRDAPDTQQEAGSV